MHILTLEQLRAATNAGGIAGGSRPRPDRAEALKRTYGAAEHDKWFREQVQQGLAEADDPNTQWVSHEEAKSSWAAKRAGLAKRI
ncbi:hypothetical protein NUH87_22595 [Pseudomonas batumici]|uniref:hypothetical protein n=1 Tax=Pseudomonas batumici TaxID=226910 RepID=UPI0030CF9E5B